MPNIFATHTHTHTRIEREEREFGCCALFGYYQATDGWLPAELVLVTRSGAKTNYPTEFSLTRHEWLVISEKQN